VNILFFLIYQIIFLVALPFYLFGLWWRNKLGVLSERFGLLPRIRATQTFWIHGASVGEVLSIEETIHYIITQHPTAQILLTSNTTQGASILKKRFSNLPVHFLPVDFFLCQLLAFWRVRPTALIIIEAERWLALFATATLLKVKLIGLNTYVKPHRVHQYFHKRLYGSLYRLFDHIFTQDQTPFKQLHVSSKHLHTIGSIKASNVLFKMQQTLPPKRATLRFTLLVGSVHENELSHYFALYNNIKENGYNPHLILVPRHFTGETNLYTRAQSVTPNISYWSEKSGDTEETVIRGIHNAIKTTDISLVCVMGVLFQLYPYADIFYLGGTFNMIGGHNVLEPAAWQLPIVTGPYIAVKNYEAHKLHALGGLTCVQNQYELISHTLSLLSNTHYKKIQGTKNKQWLQKQAATVQYNLKKLVALLYEL